MFLLKNIKKNFCLLSIIIVNSALAQEKTCPVLEKIDSLTTTAQAAGWEIQINTIQAQHTFSVPKSSMVTVNIRQYVHSLENATPLDFFRLLTVDVFCTYKWPDHHGTYIILKIKKAVPQPSHYGFPAMLGDNFKEISNENDYRTYACTTSLAEINECSWNP